MHAPPETALGFDYGRLRIGVAVGQALTGSARALAVLPTQDQRPDWDRIGALIAEWQPARLVVGVPRHADGSANAITALAERFARQLHGRYRLPVATIDERLSSREAEMRIAARGGGRSRGPVDAEAAAVILETWFGQ